jgi:hypothetical protein
METLAQIQQKKDHNICFQERQYFAENWRKIAEYMQ